LASATGVLRSAVGRQTGVKFTPTLQFRPDTVPEQSRQIEELLVSVRESDAELAQRSTGAVYAGDADPYRKPREATDDGDDEADGFDGDENGTEDGFDGDGAGSAAAQEAGRGVPGERDPS
ncbi:MAG TPA: ribosome-binding factor A, partial [Nakamurella sp.]|jgi:ribosome-binding factor A